MRHSEVWGLREVPAAAPNYAPSDNRSDIVLIGFVRNKGAGSVDFPITNCQGVTHQPDYIQVVMTYDPFVLAIVKDCPYLYRQALQITPKTMTALHPRYDPSNLAMFKAYNSHRAEMDELVRGLEDQSAIAKVHCWRKLMTEQWSYMLTIHY